MESTKDEALRIMLEKIRELGRNEEAQASIASLKSHFENIDGIDSFVIQRVKGPVSTINKYFSAREQYSQDWRTMKDLLGLMVIVDNNSDVDQVIEYLKENFSVLKNPYSENFYEDYRKKDYRESKGIANKTEQKIYDPPTDKGYQISDGYKNVKANIIFNGYPVEIQIKTKAQYIAHEVTHDGAYKTPLIRDKEERVDISSKMFPYFEALSYLQFHENTMSIMEIERTRADIQAIFERNYEAFHSHSQLFNDACTCYAISSFIFNNKEKIFAGATLNDSIVNQNLLQSEVKRVFKYTKKQIQIKDPSLSEIQCHQEAVKEICGMKYETFDRIRTKIAGNYRLGACTISGNFDMLRERDINLINQIGQSYRYLKVFLYDDEMSELITGKKPMFTAEERKQTLEQIKHVAGATIIHVGEKAAFQQKIGALPVGPEQQRQYKIGYLPGVFDMAHPGHIAYIKAASTMCDDLIVGLKSDEYVERVKHKTPVIGFKEREIILGSLRCVSSVVPTNADILPPENILTKMQQNCLDSQPCAIFLGSDWIKRPHTKCKESMEEFEHLVSDYPEIQLTSIPREDNSPSSTSLRQQGLDKFEDFSHFELKDYGEQNI